VNFNKSMLVGVNIVDYWLNAAAIVLGCKGGKCLFCIRAFRLGVACDGSRFGIWFRLAFIINCLVGRANFFPLVVVLFFSSLS